MSRRPGVDVLRGAALWAMAGYHLTWDLAHFGWVDLDVVAAPAFHWIGHAIAASFLGVAGFSLVLARLAQGELWRSPRFWRRWATVVAAAGAISAVSYWLFPEAPIFFGILHCIALSLLLALPMVEAHWGGTLALAGAALAAPMLFATPLFNAPVLWWTGLSTFAPASNDYRPLLPWLGFALLGLAIGQRATAPLVPASAVSARGARGWGVWPQRLRLAPAHDDGSVANAPAPHRRPLPACGERRLAGALAFCGRHSLAFYLIHQPLLFGFFSLLGLFIAPAPDASLFVRQCATQCVNSGGEASVCAASCGCVVSRAKVDGLWLAIAENRLTPQQKSAAHDDVIACYVESSGQ